MEYLFQNRQIDLIIPAISRATARLNAMDEKQPYQHLQNERNQLEIVLLNFL